METATHIVTHDGHTEECAYTGLIFRRPTYIYIFMLHASVPHRFVGPTYYIPNWKRQILYNKKHNFTHNLIHTHTHTLIDSSRLSDDKRIIKAHTAYRDVWNIEHKSSRRSEADSAIDEMRAFADYDGIRMVIKLHWSFKRNINHLLDTFVWAMHIICSLLSSDLIRIDHTMQQLWLK